MTRPDVPHYGVKLRSPAQDAFDSHAEEVRLIGYSVIASGIGADEVSGYGDRIDAVVRQQQDEFGGAEALARIGEADTGRALLAYDEAFLALATNQRLLETIRRLLGDYFVLSQQNSVVLRPGHGHNQAQYHRDLPYQHFVSSQPVAIGALFCIDPFTQANGGTLMLPGSHKYEPFPSPETIARLERPVEAPAGSFILFDAMLFHCSGMNATARPRRAVNHVFVLPFIRQQIDLPSLLEGRHSDDATLRRLLGYEVQTPASVLDWRERRIPKP